MVRIFNVYVTRFHGICIFLVVSQRQVSMLLLCYLLVSGIMTGTTALFSFLALFAEFDMCLTIASIFHVIPG